MTPNKFKQAVLARRPQIGLWCNSCSNITAEVIAGAGFDWILIDTEHAPNEPPMVLSQLQAMMGGTAAPVVRPASSRIRRKLSSLYWRAIDGGSPKQITDFKDSSINNFSLSRDGRWLALVRGTMASDVVLITEVKQSP